MKIKILPVLSMFLILCISCTKNSDNTVDPNNIAIEDLLLKNNEITGWTYSGSGWTANNYAELTNQINGGAEVYDRNGFVEGANQNYQGSIDNKQAEIRLTVYNMGSAENAEKAFFDTDLALLGAIEWQDGAGTAANYAKNGGLSQQMRFYKGKYLVEMDVDQDSDESLNVLKQIANNVDNKIP